MGVFPKALPRLVNRPRCQGSPFIGDFGTLLVSCETCFIIGQCKFVFLLSDALGKRRHVIGDVIWILCQIRVDLAGVWRLGRLRAREIIGAPLLNIGGEALNDDAFAGTLFEEFYSQLVAVIN